MLMKSGEEMVLGVSRRADFSEKAKRLGYRGYGWAEQVGSDNMNFTL